ncbi:MAG: IS1380 family transposase [Hyphomicrobiaceae bacterium]
MPTECSQDSFDFGTVEGRQVVGAFDGGAITSDAGALLLGQTDKAIGLVSRLAGCFQDGRNPAFTVHELAAMLRQRIFGIALGYEDIVDHDQLRHDPVLGVLGGTLTAKRSDCAPLAGKSTLNRLEHAAKVGTDPYHKITHDPAAMERLFVTMMTEAHDEPPRRLIIDLDATHDPIHGEQEGRHFNAFYDCYCYLPLYIFAGRHLLAAKLRSADKDAADGARDEVARIVAQIREGWPDVRIILRADSGFARDELMEWCEENGVDFIFGLARNVRLVGAIKRELVLARRASRRSGRAERRFAVLDDWDTRDGWATPRKVVAKAEWLDDKANPRFVVTSLHWSDGDARQLYEDVYCARGEMENRIKECQADLFAGRTSAASMRANQLRLWFAAFAYVVLAALRRIGLADTELAQATCGTIRLKLLKIGALITKSVRRVKIAFASSCPHQVTFAIAHDRLRRAAA